MGFSPILKGRGGPAPRRGLPLGLPCQVGNQIGYRFDKVYQKIASAQGKFTNVPVCAQTGKFVSILHTKEDRPGLVLPDGPNTEGYAATLRKYIIQYLFYTVK